MGFIITVLVFGLAFYAIFKNLGGASQVEDDDVSYYSLSLRSGDSLDRVGEGFRTYGD